MVSERELIEACWQEHRAILRCHSQAMRQESGSDYSAAWEAELKHHGVVLAALREVLQRRYHRALHV
jgi:hypothetical protein